MVIGINRNKMLIMVRVKGLIMMIKGWVDAIIIDCDWMINGLVCDGY